MFSLIITIISIALVAALALATLYYGGSSWTRGSAAANAATVTNQGQQIRGAMELYYAEHSEYPASLQDLVTGEYLKTLPVPPAMVALQTGLVAPAFAAGEVWALLAAGQPAFMVQDTIPMDVCQELNFLNLGSDAIRAKIDPTKAYQCFGPAEGPFTFISGVPGPANALASLKQAVTEYNAAHDPDLPVVTDADPSNPVTVAETRSKTVMAGSGEGGGEEPPAGDPGPLGFYGDDNPTLTSVLISSLRFSDLDVNAAVGSMWVGVSNKGGQPVTVNSVSITPPFFVDDEWCTNVELPAGVDASGWDESTPDGEWDKICGVLVGVDSSVAGTHNGTLTLLTDGGARTLPLRATVVPPAPEERSCALTRDPNSGGHFVFEGGGLSVGVRAYKNLEDPWYGPYDGLYSAQNLAANLSGVQDIEYEVGLSNDYTGFDLVEVTVLGMQVENPGPSGTTLGLWQGPLYRYESGNGTFHSVPAIAGRSLVNGNVNYFWPAEVSGCGNSGRLCTVRLILDKLRNSLEGQTCYESTSLLVTAQIKYRIDAGTTKTVVLTSRFSLGGAGGF